MAGCTCPHRTGPTPRNQSLSLGRPGDNANYVVVLQQFWAGRDPWAFVPVDRFAQAFQLSATGLASASALANPYDASRSNPDALAHKKHALSGEGSFGLKIS